MMGISNRFPLCGKTQQSERPDSLQNIDELHKKTITFYAVNTISKIAARSVMKYRCAVIKKEIHFRLLSLDGKYMLLF